MRAPDCLSGFSPFHCADGRILSLAQRLSGRIARNNCKKSPESEERSADIPFAFRYSLSPRNDARVRRGQRRRDWKEQIVLRRQSLHGVSIKCLVNRTRRLLAPPPLHTHTYTHSRRINRGRRINAIARCRYFRSATIGGRVTAFSRGCKLGFCVICIAAYGIICICNFRETRGRFAKFIEQSCRRKDQQVLLERELPCSLRNNLPQVIRAKSCLTLSRIKIPRRFALRFIQT